nr:hypothetical protein [Tanacetum cinerariifolium]
MRVGDCTSWVLGHMHMGGWGEGVGTVLDKYVDEILKKFGSLNVKTASTPMETLKPLIKDADAKDVYVYLYRLMIGSLMYLTTSRPDIMFVFYACTRFQVTPKVSHIHAVKRIFRYLKGQPKLGLWYSKDLPFELEAYTDKYVAAASCCGQVLWIQNQMLGYGYNFMNTKIFIDNESTICIVKNTVFHSKTKHIVIQRHFIRDSNEKKLIQMIKIHTNQNVPDLLRKAFDVYRFQYLVSRVLALETTKATQELEIRSLKRRVKKLEKKASKKTHKLKRLYKIGSSTRVESYKDASLGDQEDVTKQGRIIADLDVDEGVALVDETQGRNAQDMFDTSVFHDEEVVAEKEFLCY